MGRKECKRVNRKLIRPTLSEVQDQMGTRLQRKKPAPPEQTNAENFYYIKQMQARTPMVVVLDTGEGIHGVIEWYDKTCIKVHRTNEPNLLIMKSEEHTSELQSRLHLVCRLLLEKKKKKKKK